MSGQVEGVHHQRQVALVQFREAGWQTAPENVPGRRREEVRSFPENLVLITLRTHLGVVDDVRRPHHHEVHHVRTLRRSRLRHRRTQEGLWVLSVFALLLVEFADHRQLPLAPFHTDFYMLEFVFLIEKSEWIKGNELEGQAYGSPLIVHELVERFVLQVAAVRDAFPELRLQVEPARAHAFAGQVERAQVVVTQEHSDHRIVERFQPLARLLLSGLLRLSNEDGHLGLGRGDGIGVAVGFLICGV